MGFKVRKQFYSFFSARNDFHKLHGPASSITRDIKHLSDNPPPQQFFSRSNGVNRQPFDSDCIAALGARCGGRKTFLLTVNMYFCGSYFIYIPIALTQFAFKVY